jgi:DNA-binding NarL/FixJ family response regulator
VRPTRVLLADDHAILRQGLARILARSGEVEVVAEAADGHEAVEQSMATRPDVVVLDITMPRLGGLEAARRIRKALPGTKVLVLTMHEDEEYVLEMVRAGASGYVVKESAASELLAAVRALRGGQAYFAPAAARAVSEAYLAGGRLPEDPYERLTDREREILPLLAEGRTNAQVAELLFVSAKTVDNHRTRLMEKLGVHNAAGLVRFATRRGLLG